MSVSLVRRLLAHTSVQPEAVHRALLESGRTSGALLEALLTQAPYLRAALEGILRRGPVAPTLEPDRRWVRELPPGFCERLLAFPVGETPEGEVEVAVADAADPHVRNELEAQLERPVRLRPTSLDALFAAAGVRTVAKPASERPAVRVATSTLPTNEAAIPLVRRSDRPGKKRVSTTPGLGWSGEAPPSSGAPTPRVRPTPAEVEGRLVACASVDGIAETITWAGGPGTLVFAVRSDRFELLAAAPPAEPGSVVIPRTEITVLGLALAEGDYRGALFECGPHRAFEPWHAPGAPVFVAPVSVRDHPVLVVLLDAGQEPAAVARYGERLAVAAGRSLELLVVRRRRSLHS